ncbi:Predicted neuraminidase (sialidase) [Cellulosimicrobium aquatile]|uniref:Predicted neuraminidase (Sialidase) n=1 Tax=Cellulosimicrobium aquatile TaxID=1612203 RepID=A0A1N6Q4E0_9MICO|nr:sialidase family protein [Cellulosimicrobium aquatile]SIQ11375.1 Predicted neuraminidase (sialidase) [Cellulosimicrobium aquatile]
MTTPVERLLVSGDGEAWAQCHASTVARTGGRTLVAWFAGTREGTPDNAIWLVAEEDGLWGEPQVVLGEDDGVAWWNPVLAVAPDGRLWLFAHRGERISRWVTWYRTSTDHGRTWTAPRELVPGDASGGRGPVKNPPVVTPHGAWLAPSSVESGGADPVWGARFDRSEDAGASWALADVPLDRSRLRGAGIIQPALWSGRSGLVAVCRSSEGLVYRTTSADDGRTWTAAAPTRLPNNNSGLTAVRLPSGRVALVHNPVGEEWGARCPLSVSVSDDDGLTWHRVLDLEDGTRAPATLPGVPVPALREAGPPSGFAAGDTGIVTDGRGEYSYPSGTTDGATLLVAYTWQRRGIVLARVPLRLVDRPVAAATDRAGSS